MSETTHECNHKPATKKQMLECKKIYLNLIDEYVTHQISEHTEISRQKNPLEIFFEGLDYAFQGKLVKILKAKDKALKKKYTKKKKVS